ncbi:MAG: hypothetical protein GC150_05095 [Rhizobiales bacterium]|nr:hypothetical protein [Hyphomicrobiales bacterium]
MSDRKQRRDNNARGAGIDRSGDLGERLRMAFDAAGAPAALAVALALAEASRLVADLLADGTLPPSERTAPCGDHPASPHAIFAEALAAAPVSVIAWPDGRLSHSKAPATGYAVALTPLTLASPASADGAATLFLITADHPRDEIAEPGAPFLRPGRDHLAGGYVLYGARTAFVMAVAGRLHCFHLDRLTGRFVPTAGQPAIPPTSNRLASDISCERLWPTPARTYLEDCLAGSPGPHGREHALRWSGSPAGELHGILQAGGVLFLPCCAPSAPVAGGLALVHVATPLALVTEAAGGRASDGLAPLLERTPSAILEHAPVALGSREEVSSIERYHHDPFHARRCSPLFVSRGLFHS